MYQIFLKLQRFIFYLIILFIPTQLGKHFWPNWSYVLGLRVDYLSPTIFVTDILIASLFILWLFSKKSPLATKSQITNYKSQINTNVRNHKHFGFLNFGHWNLFGAWILEFGIFLIIIIAGIFFSKNPQAGIYGLFKLLEFCFFGIYTASFLRKKENLKTVILLFSIGVLPESLLAIAQYFYQGSIGGLLYFFGERTFNSQTPGIANAVINGSLFFRPYGTLPHPNVLAGYLIIAMTIMIYDLRFTIYDLKKYFFIFSLLAGSVALFLTMSRVAILLWTIFIVVYLLRTVFQKIHDKKFIIHHSLFIILFLVVISSILIFSPLRFRFGELRLTDESVVAREQLMQTAVSMVKTHLVFGVGIHNFLQNVPQFQKLTTQVSLFGYLQPVHNIFFLVAAETGIVGLGFFLWFISRTYKRLMINDLRLKNKKIIIHQSSFIILSVVLFLGMFDHYFLTLQQGQLLFSFVLGLCWSDN